MSLLASEPSAAKDSNEPALLSVIIPAYNVASYIAEAIDSALAQTWPAIQIIVVNDGSPDTAELEKVLLPYQGKFVYLKQENRGLSGARNTAIRAARGKYVGLLDADDAWMPDYAKIQIAIMENDSTIDVLYPDAVLFGEVEEDGHTYMETCPSNGGVTFRSLLRSECQVMIMATIRRDTLVRIGMFDENLRSVEDFDLWLRIVQSGGRIVYHREPLARYRKRMGSLSSNAIAMGNSVLEVLTKARAMPTLNASERAEIEAAYHRFQASLHLTRSKVALVQRDYRESATMVLQANKYFQSTRLRISYVLLKTVPGLLRAIFQLREARTERRVKARLKTANSIR
jgi:glycosyltransferase involved in cell wall biosynthesis